METQGLLMKAVATPMHASRHDSSRANTGDRAVMLGLGCMRSHTAELILPEQLKGVSHLVAGGGGGGKEGGCCSIRPGG